MKKDINESFFEGRGAGEKASGKVPAGCNFTKEQLSPLHKVDYQHNDGDKGDDLTCKCSRYFLDELGGQEGLIEGLGSQFDPDGVKGISQKSVDERRAYYGSNKFPPPKIKSLCEIVGENFKDPINQILLVAAIVSGAINYFKDGPKGLTEGASIALALIIIVVVGSTNNYIAEKEVANQLQSADDKDF